MGIDETQAADSRSLMLFAVMMIEERGELAEY
jgi:hypothetical protein